MFRRLRKGRLLLICLVVMVGTVGATIMLAPFGPTTNAQPGPCAASAAPDAQSPICAGAAGVKPNPGTSAAKLEALHSQHSQTKEDDPDDQPEAVTPEQAVMTAINAVRGNP